MRQIKSNLSNFCEVRVISRAVCKTIILVFSVPKSQNSNEEEKNSITQIRMLVTMATPISSHVKDKVNRFSDSKMPYIRTHVNFYTRE